MISLNVGGVPEHFNLPWHLAHENQLFEEVGIDFSWTDFFGGTGEMREALRLGTVDVAVILTEGIVADIIKGNPSKIISQYITTPLTWGVHTSAKFPYQNIGELEHEKFAISRKGSGSHLISYLNAKQQGWNTEKLRFGEVGDFEGARVSMGGGQTAALLWEKFMTKPFVDSGELKRVHEVVTPWPCFLLVAREQVIDEKYEQLELMLHVIQEANKSFMHDVNAIPLVSEYYGLDAKDAEEWFVNTNWAVDNSVEEDTLISVMDMLKSVDIIDKTVDPSFLCAEMCDLQ